MHARDEPIHARTPVAFEVVERHGAANSTLVTK
jgi:hypothetical protein